MAEFALPVTDSRSSPPLSRHPSLKKASQAKSVRRVAFSELPPKHEKKCTLNEQGAGDCRSNCLVGCAWSCLVVFAVLLGLLLFGILFVAILQSELPSVRLRKMSIPRLDVTPSSESNSKSLLSAQVDLEIDISNNNQVVVLSYGPMTLEVWSKQMKLVRTQVVGFNQNPKNTTGIQVQASVTKSKVDKYEGENLISDFKNRETVYDVGLHGSVGFQVRAFKMNGLPIIIACNGINQATVDLALATKCSIKLLPAFRT